MLTYDDALNMNYYKKTSYTGWMGGMRFLIKREVPEVAEGEEPLPPFFHAWVWPGPYIFDLTDASLKQDITFPFTEEGRKQVVDWVNERFEQDTWPAKKISAKTL